MMKFVKYPFIILAVLSSFAAKSPASANTTEVNWVNFEDAIALHEKNPKKILVDLYTDWCGWCKKMDQTTYSQQLLIQYINQNYYAVKFNAEQKQDVSFRSHIFKFVPSGQRGYHELAAALTQNKLSYPTTVFMDEKLQIIQAVPGYWNATDFDVMLHYFAEDHFKKTAWPDFQKNYKSRL